MCYAILLVMLLVKNCNCLEHRNEYMFELQNGEEICLSEDFETGQQFKFEFRVIRGNDVDVWISMNSQTLAVFNRSSGNSTKFYANPGEGVFCFSNKFSTIAHKIVSFKLEPANALLFKIQPKPGPFGSPETSCDVIHNKLEKASDLQKNFRFRLEYNKQFALKMNSTVFAFGFIVTLGIIAVGWGQIMILKKMFKNTIV